MRGVAGQCNIKEGNGEKRERERSKGDSVRGHVYMMSAMGGGCGGQGRLE